MPSFRITVTNENFHASNNIDLPSLEAARRNGIKSALEIGTDEILDGKAFFGAEIKVENGGKVLGRFIVSIGASALK